MYVQTFSNIVAMVMLMLAFCLPNRGCRNQII
jgi:hypothetical protein